MLRQSFCTRHCAFISGALRKARATRAYRSGKKADHKSASAGVDGQFIAIGGLVRDVVCRPSPAHRSGLAMGSSVPGLVTHSFGGVARNIAETFARLLRPHGSDEMSSLRGPMPCLLAVVGSSSGGGDSRHNGPGSPANGNRGEESSDNMSAAENSAEASHCLALGIDPCLLLPADAFTQRSSESASSGGACEAAVAPTPTYAALLDGHGDLVAAVADFRAIDDLPPSALTSGAYGARLASKLRTCNAIALDANFSLPCLAALGTLLGENLEDVKKKKVERQTSSAQHSSPLSAPRLPRRIVWWEPTSVAKASRVLSPPVASSLLPHVTHTSPNLAELLAMAYAVAHTPLDHSAVHGDIDDGNASATSGTITAAGVTENHSSNSGDLSNHGIDAWLAECETAAQREAPALESKLAKALAAGDFDAVSAMLAGPLASVVHAPRRCLLQPGPASASAAGLTVVLTLGPHGAVVATAAGSRVGGTNSNSKNGRNSSASCHGSTNDTSAALPIPATCAAAGVRAVWVSAVSDLTNLANLGLGPDAPPLTPAKKASEPAMGAGGTRVQEEGEAGTTTSRSDGQEPPLSINVTGAGDTMVGAAVWHLSRQHNHANPVNAGNKASTGEEEACLANAAAAVDAVAFSVAAAATAVLETSAAVPRALSRPETAAHLVDVAGCLIRVPLP